MATRRRSAPSWRDRPGARCGTWGWSAPILLVSLRLLQGLALGGEYGGTAIYVAEHAPNDKRPWYPTMRLFRHPSIADWPSVMARVAGELSQLTRREGGRDP